MKVLCAKDTLQSALSLAERMTGKHLSLPILSSVLLSSNGQELLIRATNLDIGIEIRVGAQVDAEGVVAVPGGVLSTLLGNIRSETVELVVDETHNLTVTTQKTSTKIKGYPSDDFPILPTVSDAQSFSLNVSTVISGLKAVWYGAAVSDIKPELSSVLISSSGRELTFAATDAFRLAEKKILVEEGDIGEVSLLLPFRNIAEIIRILEGREGMVAIAFDQNQISFTTNDIYVTSRLVDGVFPDYKQLIPSDFTTEAVVLKQDLLDALKITNLFADKFNRITFAIDSGATTFDVSSSNADLGENKTSVDAALSGESLTINFNYRYILDCFQSIAQDSVSLRFSGNRLLIIQGVGDPSFTYLAMPLNQ